jgi:hypothetical protein
LLPAAAASIPNDKSTATRRATGARSDVPAAIDCLSPA